MPKIFPKTARHHILGNRMNEIPLQDPPIYKFANKAILGNKSENAVKKT